MLKDSEQIVWKWEICFPQTAVDRSPTLLEEKVCPLNIRKPSLSPEVHSFCKHLAQLYKMCTSGTWCQDLTGMTSDDQFKGETSLKWFR